MKKSFILTIIICLFMPIGFFGKASAKSNSDPTIAHVIVDREYLSYGLGSPFIEDGRVMLGIRLVVEKLGGKIHWERAEDGTSIVRISEGDTTITLYPEQSDSSIALINNKQVQFDYPIFIKQGVTYVPLRFLSESLGASVAWDNQTKTATVRYHPIDEPSESGLFYQETYDDGSVKVFEKGKELPVAKYTPLRTGEEVTVYNPRNLLHIEIGAELAVSKGMPLSEEEILALPRPVLSTETAPEVYETSKYYYKSHIPLPVGEWWLSWWEK
ncbi:copper amine oxidase N-terminal domain-containing protein [Rossellomorea sp. NPDC077527]|uniref:copper amine oxidase N-terminal domain-containing protein n=1 Tax=Rossellomorea sp. NPDC077527 TaxID=3364510 RepID=UPI0037C6A6E9